MTTTRDKRARATGRASGDTGRHVRLYYWLMGTAAWRDLDTVARAAYVELAERYNGSNNGRVGLSVRTLAEALHVSRATAGRALRSLEEHGFIVTTQRGAFSYKTRHASEYRLTEFADESGALATKDFVRWQKNTGHIVRLHGPRSETAQAA
ncbi:MAG: helix-turn-helix domain-containing protein [Xanthomonadaceae bacterium]|nr:helix-turn-helix domain-containing protein [Xanthomonadaceae bacterium]